MDKILNYCLRRFNFIIDAYIHIHIQMSRMSLTVYDSERGLFTSF